jgi:hypothetical protein
MSNEISVCCRCGESIVCGDTYVSIVRNVEKIYMNPISNEEEIRVVDSSEVISFCESCGDQFDADLIGNIINAIPTDKNRIADN